MWAVAPGNCSRTRWPSYFRSQLCPKFHRINSFVSFPFTAAGPGGLQSETQASMCQVLRACDPKACIHLCLCLTFPPGTSPQGQIHVCLLGHGPSVFRAKESSQCSFFSPACLGIDLGVGGPSCSAGHRRLRSCRSSSQKGPGQAQWLRVVHDCTP